MRNTKQRSLVLEIVNDSYNHPTAYEIYQNCIKALPNISLGTVYRNLNVLVELGSIQQLEVPGQMTRYDRNICHSHFVCIQCFKIIDLKESDISFKNHIDGNLVVHCKVCYEGICCDCLRKGEDINGIKGK